MLSIRVTTPVNTIGELLDCEEGPSDVALLLLLLLLLPMTPFGTAREELLSTIADNTLLPLLSDEPRDDDDADADADADDDTDSAYEGMREDDEEALLSLLRSESEL
jgi:hypothetical protein